MSVRIRTANQAHQLRTGIEAARRNYRQPIRHLGRVLVEGFSTRNRLEARAYDMTFARLLIGEQLTTRTKTLTAAEHKRLRIAFIAACRASSIIRTGPNV